MRLILTAVAVAAALGACERAADDAGARAEPESPEMLPPPLATPFVDDGPPRVAEAAPPVAAADPEPEARCDPNYTLCVPVDSDVDCAGGRGNGPSYVQGPVRVVGRDIYGLDRDGDGFGCDR